MKRWLTLCAALFCAVIYALPATGELSQDKALDIATHTAGSIRIDTSNYGFARDLMYPAHSGVRLLYQSAGWISAKKQRRDAVGRKLYWLTYPPTADAHAVVAENEPGWEPSLHPVIDTLTSVGFDGDRDLYELLPAYNPLAYGNPLYPQYNASDNVLTSILGSPAPRPWAWPDPEGTYCFSEPQTGAFATPGFETHSAYFYDFCPLGTAGERDLGASRSTNNHVPLGLAIHQESYTWNLQNHDRMVIFRTSITNTSSTQDTLFDLAVADFVDADIGPLSYGGAAAADDLSGYVKGAGYDFAYSLDADGDGGSSPHYLASKIMLPDTAVNRHCWYWKVGDGPNDHNPLSFNFAPHQTANEKYWLVTGRNPDQTKYAPLRPEQPDIWEYQQPSPNDTRFLNALYGNLPTPANPDPAGRLHLAPGATLAYYSILFTGNSIIDLKARSQAIEAFINAGLDIGSVQGLTCIPYLYGIGFPGNGIFHLRWHSYTDPDHFLVLSKPYDAPASEWAAITVPGNSRGYLLGGLNAETWYQLKVASVYNPGPSEVYLESDTQLANLSFPSQIEDDTPALPGRLTNYPNPFNPSTSIAFETSGPGRVSLRIYDIKGRLVRTLLDSELSAGEHITTWDGNDGQGRSCGSGVYFLRLDNDTGSRLRKMLLLK